MALEGSRAKTRRAQQHLDALNESIGAFLRTKPYRVTVESDLKLGQHAVFLTEVPDHVPVEEWALLIGDCAHNLRSALDYITWEFSFGRGDRQTMFPIFRDRKKYPAAAKNYLRHLSPFMRAAIETAQPYHALNPTLTNLWLIHALDNADKHRLLTVTVSVQHSLEVVFLLPADMSAITFRPDRRLYLNARLVRGAVLAEFATEPDVQMEADFTPTIAFGKSVGFGVRAYAVESLAEAVVNVDDLIDQFLVALARDPDSPLP